jgi:hypothetical protein
MYTKLHRQAGLFLSSPLLASMDDTNDGHTPLTPEMKTNFNKLLDTAKKIVVLTGAGISAEVCVCIMCT